MNYLDNIFDNDVLNKNIINDIINNINKIELGFIISKHNSVRLNIRIICTHCIDNNIIFTEDQLNKINDIINKIKYG